MEIQGKLTVKYVGVESSWLWVHNYITYMACGLLFSLKKNGHMCLF